MFRSSRSPTRLAVRSPARTSPIATSCGTCSKTLVHEYLQTLVHPAYVAFAASFGEKSNQFNTLVEGVDSLLDEIVWSAVAPHVTDQKLRDEVEGPAYSSLPPIAVQPASRRRYKSYEQGVKLVNVVGIRNLYAAYFLGDVTKITP